MDDSKKRVLTNIKYRTPYNPGVHFDGMSGDDKGTGLVSVAHMMQI